jgi:Ca-activated chloride channel family protein
MKKAIVFISLLLLVVMGTSARVITGTVVDPGNNPIPGVTIMIKGTTTGTVTDSNGKFSISVGETNAILVFSFIGYETQEVKINSAGSLYVMMDEDVMALQECVVIGYAEQEKHDVAGSVAIRGVASSPGRYKSMAYNPPAADFNTEGYSAIHENGFKSPIRQPLSTFSIDVDAASYSNVRRFINEGQKPVTDAVRIEEMINYFDYDYPEPRNGHPFSIFYELGECPWNR